MSTSGEVGVPEWVYERWVGLMGAEELEGYRKGGFGGRIGFGQKPAVVVIDMTNSWVDPRFTLAHGDRVKQTVQAVARLLEVARGYGLPIFYTRQARHTPIERGFYPLKIVATGRASTAEADSWPAEIAPRSEDTIVEKPQSSAFHETPLRSMLTLLGVDTLIVTGISTSACVRNTATSAFACNFRPIVPIECVHDRSRVAHEHNLFDIDMKYGDVMTLEEVITAIGAECDGRSADREEAVARRTPASPG